jgi:quinol monooxygenase YgiN
MSKLVIMATIEVVPGKRDEVASLLIAHRDRSLRAEPGTLQFDVMLAREHDAKILLHEVYQDDAAFAVHANAPSIAQWRRETAGMIVKAAMTRCTLVE